MISNMAAVDRTGTRIITKTTMEAAIATTSAATTITIMMRTTQRLISSSITRAANLVSEAVESSFHLLRLASREAAEDRPVASTQVNLSCSTWQMETIRTIIMEMESRTIMQMMQLILKSSRMKGIRTSIQEWLS